MNRISERDRGQRAPSDGEIRRPPRPCAECDLRGAALCRVTREETPHGCRPSVIRRFERGRLIAGRGESGSFLGVLRRGHVRQEQLRQNGDRVLLGLAHPGDIIGGLPGLVALWDCEAATDIEVCVLDHSGLERLIGESARVRHVVAHEAQHRHQRILRAAWRLNALDSRERIIAFLVDATGVMPTEWQSDGSVIVTIEIARRDWADLTNTAVETISRTLRYLAEKHIVESLTPTRLHIRNLERLAFLAGIEAPIRAARVRPQDPAAPQPLRACG